MAGGSSSNGMEAPGARPGITNRDVEGEGGVGQPEMQTPAPPTQTVSTKKILDMHRTCTFLFENNSNKNCTIMDFFYRLPAVAGQQEV